MSKTTLMREGIEINNPLTVTSEDIGKVVGVDNNGNLALIEGGGGGSGSSGENTQYFEILKDEDDYEYVDGLEKITDLSPSLDNIRFYKYEGNLPSEEPIEMGIYVLTDVNLDYGSGVSAQFNALILYGGNSNTKEMYWNAEKNRYDNHDPYEDIVG